MRKYLFILIALSILLVGCGERDISSVETAIIGHWVSESENPEFEDTHYYISEEAFIMVDQGTRSVSDYKVSAVNEDEKWIEIQTEGRNDVGSMVRRLEFTNEEMTEIYYPSSLADIVLSTDRADSEEMQAMHELAKELLGDEGEFENTWLYVDDLTEPE